MKQNYLELIEINYIPRIGKLKSTVEEDEKIIGVHLTLKKGERIFSSQAFVGKFIPMEKISNEMMNGRGAIIRDLCLRYYPVSYENGVEIKEGTGRGIAIFNYDDYEGKTQNGYSILQPNDVVVKDREALDIFVHNMLMFCGINDSRANGRSLKKRG